MPQQHLNLDKILESYKDVELTEVEIKNLILEAKKKKVEEQKSKEYWARVVAESNPPILKATELFNEILKKAETQIPNFILDDFNQQIIFDLACYFTGDEKFNASDKNGNRSLKKGLLLYGNVGCGKTTLMRLFSENQIASYVVVSCRQVASEFSENGYDAINSYCGFYHKDTLKGRKFGHSDSLGICFDDLGTEDMKKHFGNNSNVMAEVILNRYDGISKLANRTHITTNLTGNDIESIYGNRLRSRMREMFNMISFDKSSPDRRK